MHELPPGLPPTVFIPAQPPQESPAFFAHIFAHTDDLELRGIAFANWLQVTGRAHSIGEDMPDMNINRGSQ